MGNAASGLPFVVEEEVDSYPESPETCSWRMHRGTKRVSSLTVNPFFASSRRDNKKERGNRADERRGT